MELWFIIGVVCLALYLLCSAWFLTGSLIQMHLLWHSRTKKAGVDSTRSSGILPFVSIQVPVYNERFVVNRLLEQLANLQYPRERFEIQILDDSTDDTCSIVDQGAAKLQAAGIAVSIQRRKDRRGYKAGALQEALGTCKGELIAIFDADFLPPSNFLVRMIRYFENAAIGGVQGRWLHENLEQNALTRIQAFLLDSHFQLEQKGRAAAGYFLNFNGTAGIWRKKCIVDSGGWNGDVLTEDLELSYRAQLHGWKFAYDNDITVPAELPSDFNAFKTQQFRWAKGMAQTASKHLMFVLQSNAKTGKKIHAFFHLLGSLSFIAVMGNIVLALPILFGRHYIPGYAHLTTLIFATAITLPMLCVYYYFGTTKTFDRKTFWSHLPLFLMIYMALSVQNSIAAAQGLAGHISPFIRTPKSSGVSSKGQRYRQNEWTLLNTVELLTALYLLLGICLCILWQDYFLLLFLAMVFTGLAILLSQPLQNLLTKNPRKLLPDIIS